MTMRADQAVVLRRAISGWGGGDLSNTSLINELPETLAHPPKVGFSEGVQVVFLMALDVMLVCVIVLFFLPEIPLSRRSARQQRADGLLAAEHSLGVPEEAGMHHAGGQHKDDPRRHQ